MSRCCRYADTDDDCTHCGHRIRHDPDRRWLHIAGPRINLMSCDDARDGEKLYAHPGSQACTVSCDPARRHQRADGIKE